MVRFVGAIDQGTSSTRFLVLDAAGKVVSSAQREHRQIYPAAGWVEHDPEEIWQRTKEVIREAMAKLDLSPSDLATVGVTNQRETVVAWNRTTGKPYHNAIVWNCARTASLARRFAAEFGVDSLRSVTGLPINSYFSALKMVWLFENVPGLREAAHAGEALLGTVDSWLMWNLSGGEHHVTDVTNASRTLLFNLHSLSWDNKLLDMFGVPPCALARVCSSSEVYFKAAVDTPLAGVQLSGILGDQQAALFGQACFLPGEAKATYGTGCFLMMNTGESPMQSTHGLLTTVGYQRKGKPPVYALEGAVMVSGSLLQWLRDQLEVISAAPESEALASSVGDNGGVYFVPAFAGLFAPHWREDARGTICGLTAFHSKAHIVRAALEASAFQALEVLEAMEQDSGAKLSSLKVDGGMTANSVLMQFQADVAATPVSRPAQPETTALGAAYIAGLAVGFFKDESQVSQNWLLDRQWDPVMDEATRKDTVGMWRKAVHRSLNWTSKEETEQGEQTSGSVSRSLIGAACLVAGLALGAIIGGRSIHRR